jgi:hypothetical protein
MIRILVSVLPVIAVSLVCSNATAQETTTAQKTTTAVSNADKKAAATAFDALEKGARDLFVKCKKCRGRGKVKNRTCSVCLGHRKVFEGDYQELLDTYIAYCDAIEKYAKVLEADAALSKQVHATRDWYCSVIGHEMGPQKDQLRINRGATARYSRGKKRDGECDRLAFETLVGDKPPADKAMAFEGRVAKILKKDGQEIAEVRFSVGSYRSRTCWVLVPDGVKWMEYAEAKIIGKVIAAEEQRKRFNLDNDIVIVKPYHGTR